MIDVAVVYIEIWENDVTSPLTLYLTKRKKNEFFTEAELTNNMPKKFQNAEKKRNMNKTNVLLFTYHIPFRVVTKKEGQCLLTK